MTDWRAVAKGALARLPMTAELYQRWWSDGRAPTGGYLLERLSERLPAWTEAVRQARKRARASHPKRVLVFGYLPWWLEYAVAMALLLRAEGHQVDLAYLPQRGWDSNPHPFDLRRSWEYMKRALAPLASELGLLPLISGRDRIPEALAQQLEIQSRLDVQYTLQREEIAWRSDGAAASLFALRQARNQAAAGAAHHLLSRGTYDSVILPNGSILEFGALFRTARSLGLRTVTYEFGERREHLWLAHEAQVMRLPTDGLWAARGHEPLADDQFLRLREMYEARRGGRRWSNFARRWQRAESKGAHAVRQKLGLASDRPVVLLCTNVVGDSLALDRQVFTQGMADWLAETVQYFADRADAQLVVRIHPGEVMGAGHPSVEIVREALPDLPSQVIVVPPDSDINTYDLIELAHLGLVYTSTVGLEMAMYGVPVVVSGATHYRGKGFTHDPGSMEEYRTLVGSLLREPAGRTLPQHQVELAWRYAYLFFFEYPFPFPWHLLSFWEDLEARPLEGLVRGDGLAPYERTLRALVGESVDWRSMHQPKLAGSGVGR